MSKKQGFVPQEQLSTYKHQQLTQQVQKLQEIPSAPSSNPVPKVEFKEEAKILPVIEMKVLPSKFIPYPSGSTICYRPYTFGEVKKFNQSKMSVPARFEFILEGIETSFDKYKMTFSDFLFIALSRKISSVGNTKFQVTYLCKECGFKNTEALELMKLDFFDLELPGYPIILDIGGKELHFGPITLEGYLDLAKNNLLEDKVAFYSKQVINIPYDEAYKIIYAANDEEGEMLLEMDKMCFHGLKPVEVICQNQEREFLDSEEESSDSEELPEIKKVIKPCEHVERIDLDSPEVLVSPFRRDSESLKSRIRFGTKA